MPPLYHSLNWLFHNDLENYEVFYAQAAYLSALYRQINITHDNVKTLTPETLFLLQADHDTLEKVIPLCMNQFPYPITNLQRFEVAPPLDLHAATLNLRDHWNSFILKLAKCLYSYHTYFTPELISNTFNQLNVYSLSLLSGLAPTHHLLMKTILDEIAQIKLTKAIDVFSLVGSQTLITREDSLEKEAYRPDNLHIPDHASTDELSAWQKSADLDIRGVDPILRTPENWDTAFNALGKIGNNLGVAEPQIDKNSQYPSLTLRTQTPQGKLDFTITGQPSMPATNISFAISLTGPQKGLIQCVDPFMLLSIISRKVTSAYLTNLYSLIQIGQLNTYHPEFHSSMVFLLKNMAQVTATKYSLIAEQIPQIKTLLSSQLQIVRTIFKIYQDKIVKENPQYENWLMSFFQQSFDKEFNAYLLEQWKNASNPVIAPVIELPARPKKILPIYAQESTSFRIVEMPKAQASFKIYPAVQANDFVESPGAKERRLAEEVAMREKAIMEKAAAQKKIAEEETTRKNAEATAIAEKKLAEAVARKKAAEAEAAQKKAAEEEIARQKAVAKEAARRHAEQEQQRKLEEQAEQRRLKAIEKQKAQEEQQRREAKTAQERAVAEVQRKAALIEERKAADALLAQWKAEKKGRKKTDIDTTPAKEPVVDATTNIVKKDALAEVGPIKELAQEIDTSLNVAVTTNNASTNVSMLTEITPANKIDVSANTPLPKETTSTNETAPKAAITPAADSLITNNTVTKAKKTKQHNNAPAKISKDKSIAKKDNAVPVVATPSYFGQIRQWVQEDLRAATPADIRHAVASLVAITVGSFIFHMQYTFDQKEKTDSIQQPSVAPAAQATTTNSTQHAIMLFISLTFTVLLALKIMFPRHMPSPTRLILNALFPGTRATPGVTQSTTPAANNSGTFATANDGQGESSGSGRHRQKHKGGK